MWLYLKNDRNNDKRDIFARKNGQLCNLRIFLSIIIEDANSVITARTSQKLTTWIKGQTFYYAVKSFYQTQLTRVSSITYFDDSVQTTQ
jgi:hypothetical protein